DCGEPARPPDGRFAVAVRRRYGATELVRVELATGRTEALPTDVPVSDWPVWSHPRVSPDGSTVASLLHRAGRWRLVTLPAAGGAVRELAIEGAPFRAAAWTQAGARPLVATDASGIWNLALVDPRAAEPSAALTRVTGAAFGPAPSPDGNSIFFLSLTAKGVDVRRLDRPSAAVALSPAP